MLAAWVASLLVFSSVGAAPSSAAQESPRTTATPQTAELVTYDDTPTFVPLDATRAADTRPGGATADGAGPKGAVGPAQTITVQIAGRFRIPTTGVRAVAFNLTADQATGPTYLTAFPTGRARPLASNLNPVGPQPVANHVVVEVGGDGTVSVFNAAGSVHVIVDLAGWYPTVGDFVPVGPSRFLDTRPTTTTVDGQGAKGAVSAAGRVRIPIAGRAGIPSTGVAAVVVNITADQASQPTYLTAFPTGEALPTASNLNPNSGRPLPNLATVKLGVDGSISIFNAFGNVHAIVDVTGWYPTGGDFRPLSPQRLIDTRPGEPTVDGQGPKGIIISSARWISLHDRGSLPPADVGLGAVVANITAVGATSPMYVVAYSDNDRPLASNLNVFDSRPVSNFATVKAGIDEYLYVAVSTGSSHLIVDVAGWFPRASLHFGDLGRTTAETLYTEGLAVNGRHRYHLDRPAGARFSVAVAGGVGYDLATAQGTRCDVSLRVIRPNGTTYGTDTCPTSPELEVDVVTDAAGTWLVEVTNLGLKRARPGAVVTVAPTLQLGPGELSTPLAAGQDARFPIELQAGQLRSVGVAFAPPGCDIELIVRRPNGTEYARGGRPRSDCVEFPPRIVRPFVPLSLPVTADLSGTWTVEVSNGPVGARDAVTVRVDTPVDGGAVGMPGASSVTVAPRLFASWTVSATSGQRFAVSGAAREGCIYNEIRLRLVRPNGTVEEEVSCTFGSTIHARPDVSGLWRIEVYNDSDTSKTIQLQTSRPALYPFTRLGGWFLPSDLRLLQGQDIDVTMSLNAGDVWWLDFPCNSKIVVRRPNGTVSPTAPPPPDVCHRQVRIEADQTGTWTAELDLSLDGSAVRSSLDMSLGLRLVGSTVTFPAVGLASNASVQFDLVGGVGYRATVEGFPYHLRITPPPGEDEGTQFEGSDYLLEPVASGRWTFAAAGELPEGATIVVRQAPSPALAVAIPGRGL